MDNTFATHTIETIAKTLVELNRTNEQFYIIEKEIAAAREMYQHHTQTLQLALCKLIGTTTVSNIDNSIVVNEKALIAPDVIEEVKNMLTTLTIKGSVRRRADGLIELRTQALGSIYGHTKEEIERKLTAKLKTQKSKKSNVAPKLSEFFEDTYLPYKKKTLAASSISIMLYDYKYIIEQRNFDKPLNQYTAKQIEEFIYSVPKTHKQQKLRGLFNNIFAYAKRIGVIKNNPCDNVEKMKHETLKGHALSFDEQLAFFDTLYASTQLDLTEKLYYTFIYLTGARRTEAIELKATDVDFANNVLHIPGTKTKGSNRAMPLYPLVKRLLKIITPQKRSQLYFPLSKFRASALAKQLSKNHHLHELRHTFGTIAICVQKIDHKTVSIYMGHSNIGTTLNTYTHPEHLDIATFYDGALTEAEKLARLQQQYAAVLSKISQFLEANTQILPK